MKIQSLNRLLSTLVLATSLSASTALAAGDAGCGLGSLVIQKNTKISQTLALTTNGTLLTQLFGITSGTSNCSSSALVYNEQEAVKFAETNYETLRIEAAQGSGESLAALGELLGCKDASRFGALSKANFDQFFPASASSQHVGTALVQSASARVKSDCQI